MTIESQILAKITRVQQEDTDFVTSIKHHTLDSRVTRDTVSWLRSSPCLQTRPLQRACSAAVRGWETRDMGDSGMLDCGHLSVIIQVSQIIRWLIGVIRCTPHIIIQHSPSHPWQCEGVVVYNPAHPYEEGMSHRASLGNFGQHYNV